jgi:hypothetical protein
MSDLQFQVLADSNFSPLESGIVDGNRAKMLYDLWKKDSNVFNVHVLRLENDTWIQIGAVELSLLRILF